MKSHVLFACLLLGCSISTGAVIERDLIGWSERNDATLHADRDPDAEPRLERQRGPEVLSWEPRVFLYRNLLTNDG